MMNVNMDIHDGIKMLYIKCVDAKIRDGMHDEIRDGIHYGIP